MIKNAFSRNLQYETLNGIQDHVIQKGDTNQSQGTDQSQENLENLPCNTNDDQCQSMIADNSRCQLMSADISRYQPISVDVSQCQSISADVSRCQSISADITEIYRKMIG